jgi:hypothetical protein
MPCVICEEPISERHFATSGIFLPPGDQLWGFCDACMHWSCYAKWEHRERFAAAYVQMWIDYEKTSPYWARVFLDDLSFITINPNPPVSEARVHLFRTGSEVRIPLPEWEMWVQGTKVPLTSHPVEAAAWREALPRICDALPTQESLHAAADWSSKEKVLVDSAIANLEELATIEIYNKRCEELRKELESSGLVCPHCHERTRNIRFYDKALRAQSYFVCQLCARSFRLEDLVEVK